MASSNPNKKKAKSQPETVPSPQPARETSVDPLPDPRQLLLPPVQNLQSSLAPTNPTETDQTETTPMTSTDTATAASAPATLDLTTASENELEAALLDAKAAAADLLVEVTETHARLDNLVAAREVEVTKVRDIRAELRRREDEADGIVPTRATSPATSGASVSTDASATVSDRKPRGKVPSAAEVIEYIKNNPGQTYESLAVHYDIARTSINNMLKTLKDMGSVKMTLDGRTATFSV